MGFKFSFLCDLLSNLENNRILKASTAERNKDPDARTVSRWFAQHGRRLHHQDTNLSAFLSCLFPEKRTDRVYWLNHNGLARIIGRCLYLGWSRREELDRYRTSGGTDLGECVENVMRQAENQIYSGQEVTVEEIDAALSDIASRCRFSGPRVRRTHTAVDVDKTLGSLYTRLSSRDAKWLTRMILKSYHPVVIPIKFTLRSVHFLLPHLLLFQDSFDSALEVLASEPIRHFPPRPEPGLAKDLGVQALEHLTPVIGIKIGRPDYYKARSIKHCCRMANRRRISVERKYDGEYCQIHIDLSNPSNTIQIFSKSGKDSSADRSGINPVLRQSLRIGQPECRFSRRCILEGELLVWSDKRGDIADFHKLRKFISRSGIHIGTQHDSPPQPYEHLMIVFFDVLLLDDDVCLRKPHRERRLLLKDMIQAIPGHADIAEQQVLDFGRMDSQNRLERVFEKGVNERWEGFVLKACEDPYFPIMPNETSSPLGHWIKLKKDYIPGLGDTLDLALVGGKFEARDAGALREIRKLCWTHFFIGCLVNKDAVLQFNATPRFRLVDIIDRYSMHPRNMQLLNQYGEFYARSPDSDDHGFDIEYGHTSLPFADVIFKKPFVVEMLGSGFEKASGARFFTLRFPRIQKIHWDRMYTDAASFSELQIEAENARAVPEEDLQEEERWTKRLKPNGSGPYIGRRSQSVLSTASTAIDREQISANEKYPTADVPENGRSGLHPPPNTSENPQPLHMANNNAPGIKIYVDETAASKSSSDDSEGEGVFLTENDNLSSHQNSRDKHDNTNVAKVLSAQQSSEKMESSESVNRSKVSETIDLTIDSPPSRSAHTADGIDRDNIPSLASQTSRMTRLPKSPLEAVPLFTWPTPLGQEYPTNSLHSKCIFNLHEFLNKLSFRSTKICLKSSNPHTISQDHSFSLVLIDHVKDELGPKILEVGNEVASKRKTSGFPSNGSMFFVDSGFINSSSGIEDRKFCLRSTWENIGKVYFYAGLTWGKPFSFSGPPSPTSDEVPCTPWESNPAKESNNQSLLPEISSKIVVNFDPNELNVLGEFTSLEPLVHVSGRDYDIELWSYGISL